MDLKKASREEKIAYAKDVMKHNVAKNISNDKLDKIITEFIQFADPALVAGEVKTDAKSEVTGEVNKDEKSTESKIDSDDKDKKIADMQAQLDAMQAVVASHEKPEYKKGEYPTNQQGKVRIKIAEDDTDRQPVFVGLNGKGFAIKRGVAVEVPPGVVEILENAEKTVYKKIGEPGAEQMVAKTVPMYPFSVLSPA